MSIRNINELDNNSNIQNIENNKVIHALANMGQRMGVKGDSIIYKSIELINVFNENINSENISKLESVKNNINDYIGYLYYVNNDDTSISCKYGVIKKSELMEAKNGYINNSNTLLVSTNNNYRFFNISKDIFNELYTKNTNIEGINVLNNINQIGKNSIIKVKNNHLYSLIFGEIINSENNDYEIIYNDFDLETNSLKYALRAFKESDNYKLYEFDINNDKNPILNIYTLNLSNIINTDNLLYNQNIQKTFSDYFTNTNNVINNFKNIDISDLNYIKSSNFIFGYFFDSKLKSYKLNYNNENNTKLSLNTLENTNDNDELTNIINRINYINNDINVLIPAIIKYYHYNFYSSNINNTLLRILQNIYENMCYKHYISYSNENINDKEINFNDNRFVLYFPLDYKLFYECNKNNIFDIYKVNNLYINRLNLENYDVNLISYDELLSNILFSSNLIKQSMFDVYNVTFNYNEHYDNNYISSIESVYLYTLPYIDKSNYNWYINGQNSGMTSYLNGSLFQNIIIINSISVEENNIEGKYLTNIPDDILHYFNNGFEVKEFDISYERIKSNTIDSERNQLNNNVFIKDTITFSTLLPKTIEYDYANIYKNTLIISLSKFNENNLDNCLMCTIWKYDVNDEGNYDWIIIKDSSTNDVLDLSNFLNLGLLKNRSLNTKDYIFKYFGMLMNDLGKDYHNPYGDDIITLALLQKDKNNDLGLNLSVISSNEISIVDNKLLTKNNKDINNISEITQTDKYLNNNNINNVDKNIKITKENNEINSESKIIETSIISGENITYDNHTEIDYTNLKDYTIKNTPLLNISEVLLDHSQVLNRLNVISLSLNKETNEKKIYNTIIGVELDENKKNIFAIRPSSINIDIGTNTLIDQNKIDEFKELDKIVIDFNNIELKGNNIELNGNVKSGLIKQQLSDNSYIYYKDFVLFTDTMNTTDNTNTTNDDLNPITIKQEINNDSTPYNKMIINIKKLLEINNINFFDVDNINDVPLITFNNDITIDKNNNKILLTIDKLDYIEIDNFINDNFIAKCSKDLRIIKYVNNNDTKYIFSLV